MENQTNNADFTELRGLLQEQAVQVPPCDLEDGFLRDLHAKIQSENMKRSSLSLLWERVNVQIENFMSPSAAWGGAALATVALALGLFFHEAGSDLRGAVTRGMEQSPSKIKRVKADNHIDYNGNIPAFYSEQNDF